ncbi:MULTISPECIES: sialidase family protein [unclassified Rhizobium]|uniref:sialidase family protein n=1 Tax=unclassified Rhizobium TaxID=2613769 RepID=UPI000715C0DE|nr:MULTISPECIES: exo-alpha-sialidase [unclassified Rhizobium]KQS90843.1 glycosyl hydrolase [Rhizobium sp. Leaf391]KQS95931.1 glycosyl hydrolase [Rhizobium sp. Leaf386]KQU09994.1 glycosyl hydrolase [Rhizobium sp. Leaf453]
MSGLNPEEIPSLMDGVIASHTVEAHRLDAFLPSPCVQNHAANLAFLADGTLTCVWFGGTMEGMGDISIYLSRLTPGSAAWSAPEKMSDDPAKSEQNPLIFNAPDGNIWLIFTSQTSGNQDGAIVKRRISSDGGLTFGPVDILCDIPGTFVRQPIVVNGGGAWLLPVFRCIGEPGQRWTGDVDTAAVLVSRDAGASWQMVDVPDSIGAVHMNILPQGDGSMVALFRNRFATQILCSVSDDDGMTWSAPKPTQLPNNNSSIQAAVLADGRIAVIYNHSNALTSTDRRQSLYDEIEAEEGVSPPAPEAVATERSDAHKAIWGVPRAPMSLVFSADGAKAFTDPVDLETGDGYCLTNNSKDALNREYSYPSIVEGADGALHIAYTYYRRAIKYVRLEPSFID